MLKMWRRWLTFCCRELTKTRGQDEVRLPLQDNSNISAAQDEIESMQGPGVGRADSDNNATQANLSAVLNAPNCTVPEDWKLFLPLQQRLKCLLRSQLHSAGGLPEAEAKLWWRLAYRDSEVSELEAALHLACKQGHLENVQWLVSQGAAVGTRAADGSQPIHAACSQEHLEVAQWLVSKGAAVDASANDGSQPI